MSSKQEYEDLSCPGCGAHIKREKPATEYIVKEGRNVDLAPVMAILKDLEEKVRAPKSKKEKEDVDADGDTGKKNSTISNEITYPSYMPGEYCASGDCALGGVHPNKNYKRKAQKKCKNCDQFAPDGAPRCAWCGKDNFSEMDDEDLEIIGIKLPKVAEHEHDHHEHE